MPLYVLVSKLKKKSVANPKFQWIEDELMPRYALSNSANSTSNTSLTVKSSYKNFVNAYDVIYNVDGPEWMLVTNVTTGSTLTVVRGWGSRAAAAASVQTDDCFLILGSAFEEGAAQSAVNTLSTKTETKVNYTQIFRKKVEITGTLAQSDLYGGSDRQYQRKKKGIELMRDFESAFWWGVDSASSGTSHQRRTMAGVNHFISTNSTTSIGTLTETEFEGCLRGPFRYGGTQKYMFAAPLVVSVISQWAQGKLNMVPKDKTYGIAISQYLSPHGTLNIVKENLFENSYIGHQGESYIVELGQLQYVYMNGRDVKLQTNIGTIGDDKFMDQYLCEISLEMHNEQKHAKLSGVTG